jgi:hypothetical protein
MTIDNGPDDSLQKPGGKDQRPYATLDLKAEPVSSGESEAEVGTEARVEQPAEASTTPPREEPLAREDRLLGIATHVGAGVLGGLLALVLGYFIYDREPQVTAPPAEAVASLRSELARTSAKLAEIDSKLRETAQKAAAAGSANPDVGGLQKQLAELTDRLARVEARPSAAAVAPEAIQHAVDPLAARITDLDARLANLAKAQSEIQTNSKAAALAIALYNLRRAANDGRPFAEELKSLAAMSPVPLDLAPLEAVRDRGVPSLKQLKADFDGAANRAIDLENRPESDSFTSELWSKVKSFIRVRRKGDVPGDTTRAILARAEYQLDAGNLTKAAVEIDQLKGPPAEAMKPWQAELKAKITADDALAGVEAKLLAALGGEDAGKRGG